MLDSLSINSLPPKNIFVENFSDVSPKQEVMIPVVETTFGDIKLFLERHTKKSEIEVNDLKDRIKEMGTGLTICLIISIAHVVLTASLVFGLLHGSITAIVLGTLFYLVPIALIILFTAMNARPRLDFKEKMLLSAMVVGFYFFPIIEVGAFLKLYSLSDIKRLKKQMKDLLRDSKELKGVNKLFEKRNLTETVDIEALVSVLKTGRFRAEVLKFIAEQQGTNSEMLNKIIAKAIDNVEVLKAVYVNNNYSVEKFEEVLRNMDISVDLLAIIAERVFSEEDLPNKNKLLCAIANSKKADANMLWRVYSSITLIGYNSAEDNNISLALATHPNANADIFTGVLAIESSESVLRAVAKHNNSTVDILRTVFEKVKELKGTEILCALASNPNADTKLLEELLAIGKEKNNNEIVKAVLKNSRAKAEVLLGIAKDESYSIDILRLVAKHPNSTDNVYESLMQRAAASADDVKFFLKERELNFNSYTVNSDKIKKDDAMQEIMSLPAHMNDITDRSWKGIKGKFGEDLKMFFSKLEESQDYLSDKQSVRKRVARVAEFIEKDEEVKSKVIMALKEYGKGCPDAATTGLEVAEANVILLNVEKDNLYKALCSYIFNEHKKTLLQKACLEIHQQILVGKGDIVETYLQNLIKYKEELGIIVNTQGMLYDGIGLNIDIDPILNTINSMTAEDLFIIIRHNSLIEEKLEDILQDDQLRIEKKYHAVAERAMGKKLVAGNYGSDLYEKILKENEIKVDNNNELKNFFDEYKIHYDIFMATGDVTQEEEKEFREELKTKKIIGSLVECGFLTRRFFINDDWK